MLSIASLTWGFRSSSSALTYRPPVWVTCTLGLDPSLGDGLLDRATVEPPRDPINLRVCAVWSSSSGQSEPIRLINPRPAQGRSSTRAALVGALYLTYRKQTHIMLDMSLSDSIKPLRQRLGLTQKALAAALGVHPNTVARWERGELGISAPMIDRLERVASTHASGTVVARSSAVTLDPHHEAILDALNRKLDPDGFETCAADLLRRDWPTLVLVRGGADDGFDGAVADATDEPFPLVTTTSEKLVPNLARNLDRAKRKGWHSKRALFATSRRITGTTRNRLSQAARERGVTLIQAYDQDWFAQRLYREPQWCWRLLRVTGRPAALSLFPASQRPMLGKVVLGREQETRWLLQQDEDCLLIGEPGSGKTFLLWSLAQGGHARFLVDDDRANIANDLRKLHPSAVIVDDAHADPARIANLDQIRNATGAKFRIIATSWPGAADEVRSALKVGSTAELTLDRIDANTMVDIIKSIGVLGPDRLLYVIRKQAAGRPGLATTLAHLCLSGNVRDVVSGESLASDLAPRLNKMLGVDTLGLLAPFALGGDAGAKQAPVCARLGMSQLEMRRNLALLGAAGVIRERAHNAISVDPEPIRWAMVKKVFFDGPAAFDIEPFLEIVEEREDALRTLIGARSHGAAIVGLEGWLETANSTKLWSAYSSLGPMESQYVLERRPELIQDIAQPTLNKAPEIAISVLLGCMVDEQDSSLKSPHPLMEELKTWSNGVLSDGAQVLDRRLTIIRHTLTWWERTRSGDTAIRALCVAFQPGLSYTALDPGIGDTMYQRSRALRSDELRGIAKHWRAVLKVVRQSEHVPWVELFELVEAWLYPQARFFPPVKVDDDTRDFLRVFSGTMLRGIAEVSRKHPGLQHRIGKYSQGIGLSLPLNFHSEFEVLVPMESFAPEDWETQHERWSDKLGKFADVCKTRSLEDVASLLEWCEREADLAGIRHPRLSHRFCAYLAQRTADPITAADALMRHALPSALVAPFVRRAAADGQAGWDRLARRCLDEDEYLSSAVETVLRHSAAPSGLLTAALEKAGEMPHLESFLNSSSLSIPEATMKQMLQSSVPRVSVAAAVGYWLAHRGEVLDPLRTAWRLAILRSARDRVSGQSNSHWVGEILSKDSGLAVDWLVSSVSGTDPTSSWATWDMAKKVAGSLGLEQREMVLTRVDAAGASYVITEVMKVLVGGDLGLYNQLLDSRSLENHHLDPLEGDPDHTWRTMALAARERGYSTQDVVDATLGSGWSWLGSESDMWAGRRQGFEALLNDPDDRIAEIARAGADHTTEWERAALDRERETTVEGRH